MKVHKPRGGLGDMVADLTRKVFGRRRRSGDPAVDAMEGRLDAMRLATRSAERSLKAQRKAYDLIEDLRRK